MESRRTYSSRVSTSTLCVIDMQPTFSASKDCLPQVIGLVRQFKKYNRPIFLAEYCNYGPSHKEIRDELEGYDKCWTVSKPEDDGSRYIAKVAAKHEVSTDNITLCGVNTCYCVRHTALGFIYCYNSRVEIISGAVNCPFCGDGGCVSRTRTAMRNAKKFG